MVCLSGPSLAQDVRGQAATGAWSVARDPRLGLGCFANRTYENGTNFRIGLNRLTNRGYIAVGSPAWSSLKRGHAYPLRLVFGSARPRNGRATAVYIDGTMTLWMGFVDADVFVEFVDASTLQVWSHKQLLTELALRGSRDAFLQVVRCQAGRQR
jgi:hypothetical protein